VVGGYTCVRAHHADVGGSRPGSMPPDSRTLEEEGLVLPPSPFTPELEAHILASVRTPGERRADLAAQAAACRLGAERWRELLARFGAARLAAAAVDLLDYVERRAVAALAGRVPEGSWQAEDWIEDDGTGTPVRLCVRVTSAAGRLTMDFAGTGNETWGNANCPIAVTRSAALFVVRCLIGGDLPVNGGLHRVLTLRVPRGSLLNATPPHAVVAGNVETSQRVADVLFRALGQACAVPAQGQGTMNNITFGGDGWTYYETLGGGQGASPGVDGPCGVHVGMSNTRNTPIEVFELEHPMRIRAYALRRGSGGTGSARGGDGIIREYEALAPVSAAVIAERRARAPAGAMGGGDGACGRTLLNGTDAGARLIADLAPGDVLRIETPGGGGYGKARKRGSEETGKR
jgi:N-methylhydantoinase B